MDNGINNYITDNSWEEENTNANQKESESSDMWKRQERKTCCSPNYFASEIMSGRREPQTTWHVLLPIMFPPETLSICE